MSADDKKHLGTQLSKGPWFIKARDYLDPYSGARIPSDDPLTRYAADLVCGLGFFHAPQPFVAVLTPPPHLGAGLRCHVVWRQVAILRRVPERHEAREHFRKGVARSRTAGLHAPRTYNARAVQHRTGTRRVERLARSPPRLRTSPGAR